MNTTIKYVLAVLAIAAVVLGYLVYQKGNIGESARESAQGAQNAAQPSDSADRSAATRPTTSAEVKKLLNTPKQGATAEEQRRFAEMIAAAAVRTDSIEVSGCKSVPTVSTFQKGGKISFVNKDDISRTVVFDAEHFFVVPARQSLSVVAEFGKGAGIYGFGCDASSSSVGIVLLTE